MTAETFLITPMGTDRCNIAIEDIVLIRNGVRRRGRQIARRSVQTSHEAIYKTHPDIHCVTDAHYFETAMLLPACNSTRARFRRVLFWLRDIPIVRSNNLCYRG